MEPGTKYVVVSSYQGNTFKIGFETLEAAQAYAADEKGKVEIFEVIVNTV